MILFLSSTIDDVTFRIWLRFAPYGPEAAIEINNDRLLTTIH